MTLARFRDLPFPFRGILSISNDIDGLSFVDFIDLHHFLNTDDKTQFGLGVNLDISDSFWFFSARSEINDAFSFFDGLSRDLSPYAESIFELVNLGYLDTLHSWGNFNQFGGFKRSLAESAAKEMLQWPVKPMVWTNHGDVHNHQNIGTGLGDRPWFADSAGNKQRVIEYHTDLLGDLGFTFAWRAPDTTSLWGLDRRVSALEFWEHSSMPQNLLHRYGSLAKRLLKGSKRVNTILEKTTLHDGKSILFFLRYLRSWQNTKLDDLIDILAPNALDDLERRRGIAIIMTHFGFGSKLSKIDPILFSRFRDLQKRERDGRLLVMSTARTLTWLYAKRHLALESHADTAANKIEIKLSWRENPFKGIKDLGTKALHNISIDVPHKYKGYRITFEGNPIPFTIHESDNGIALIIQTFERKPFPYERFRKVISDIR